MSCASPRTPCSGPNSLTTRKRPSRIRRSTRCRPPASIEAGCATMPTRAPRASPAASPAGSRNASSPVRTRGIAAIVPAPGTSAIARWAPYNASESWEGGVIYVCVDCEASGPVPPLYNLLSIGATVVRPAGDHHELGESFYVEIAPIFPGFDPGALAVCGLDPERLRVEGAPPRDAMEALTRFVREENDGSGET